jgi:hypothetical protein
MTKQFIYFVILICSLTVADIVAQTEAVISSKDFEILKGNWYGSLTYLDYSSNKPYTMPADLVIEQIGETNEFIFSNMYPDEANANSVDTLRITQDGKMINEGVVKSVSKLDNGNTEAVTEFMSVDGNENKPALIRHTYTMGQEVFTVRKDVQFTGQSEWLKRHEFSYTRNKPVRQ